MPFIVSTIIAAMDANSAERTHILIDRHISPLAPLRLVRHALAEYASIIDM